MIICERKSGNVLSFTVYDILIDLFTNLGLITKTCSNVCNSGLMLMIFSNKMTKKKIGFTEYAMHGIFLIDI